MSVVNEGLGVFRGLIFRVGVAEIAHSHARELEILKKLIGPLGIPCPHFKTGIKGAEPFQRLLHAHAKSVGRGEEKEEKNDEPLFAMPLPEDKKHAHAKEAACSPQHCPS